MINIKKNTIIVVVMSYNVMRLVYSNLYELMKYYNVHLITFDTLENRLILENKINSVHFVKFSNNRLMNHILFVKEVISQSKIVKANLIIVHIFQLSFLLPLLIPRNKLVLVFYHFDVGKNYLRRMVGNARRYITIMLFKYVTYAHDVMPRLLLKIKNVKYIPASFDILSRNDKEFGNLRLLYIGSLNNRHIHFTIKGIREYLNRYDRNIIYHIIGDGSKETKLKILEEIEKNDLKDYVFYHGRLDDNEIIPYFNNCNIGVSFVPITNYYTNNIVTKTYEYLLSGMAVIGTATNANKTIIKNNTGVLVQDDPESFCQGLKEIFDKKYKLRSSEIRSKVYHLSHQNVMEHYWVKYLNDIISKKENNI